MVDLVTNTSVLKHVQVRGSTSLCVVVGTSGVIHTGRVTILLFLAVKPNLIVFCPSKSPPILTAYFKTVHYVLRVKHGHLCGGCT